MKQDDSKFPIQYSNPVTSYPLDSKVQPEKGTSFLWLFQHPSASQHNIYWTRSFPELKTWSCIWSQEFFSLSPATSPFIHLGISCYVPLVYMSLWLTVYYTLHSLSRATSSAFRFFWKYLKPWNRRFYHQNGWKRRPIDLCKGKKSTNIAMALMVLCFC